MGSYSIRMHQIRQSITKVDMNSNPNGDSADEVFNFSTLPRSGEREFAQSMDQKDPLKHLRESFHIPSQKSLNTNTLLLQGNFSSPWIKAAEICGY